MPAPRSRAALLLAALAGCAPTAGVDPLPGITVTGVDCASATPDAEVAIVDLAFAPGSATIPSGGVVRWTNEGEANHTVTSGAPESDDAGAAFESGVLRPGDSYCLRFEDSGEGSDEDSGGEGGGEVTYFCEIHPEQMRDATITLSDGDGG